MCNKNNVKVLFARNPWTVCRDCGEVIDSQDRCGCDYRRAPSRVNWNSRIIAAVAGILFAASLFIAPVKAQDVQPQPTPTVGGGPQKLDEHHVYFPMVAAPSDDEVTGTVSWCPSCSPRR